MTDVQLNETTIRPEPARLIDFVLFFFGWRESILRMVDSTGGLWFSALLVLSAAIAREYDAESLLHEPWHLLGPFGASIVLASVLFLITQFCRAVAKQKIENALDDYRAFLTGYWLTAPLAWLYAVPVESMTDEVAAVKYNLTALSVVSLWRVLLFSRVVSVRFRLPFWVAIVWIGLPCSVIAFVAAFQALMPMIAIMGGLRLTDAQVALREFQTGVLTVLIYTIPVLFVAWITSSVWLRKRATRLESTPATRYCLSRIQWAIPMFALLSLACLAWCFQPPLYRARVVDQLLQDEKLDEAVAQLMKHQRGDFPAVWDPPPTFPLGDSRRPSLEKLIDQLVASQTPQWTNDLLLRQASEILLRQNDIPVGTQDLEMAGQMLGGYSEEEAWPQIERTLIKLQQLETSDREEREIQSKLLESARQRQTERDSEKESAQ